MCYILCAYIISTVFPKYDDQSRRINMIICTQTAAYENVNFRLFKE